MTRDAPRDGIATTRLESPGGTEVRHVDDPKLMERAFRVRQLVNDSIRRRTPQERDRLMQVNLAQARGPAANAYLLRCAMNFALRIRKVRRETEFRDG